MGVSAIMTYAFAFDFVDELSLILINLTFNLNII